MTGQSPGGASGRSYATEVSMQDRYKRSHLMLAGTLVLIALIGVLGYLIGD